MVFTEERKEEKIEGLKEDRKIVYLIGDSSCMGYREAVKKELAGEAEVVYPEENGRCSQYVLLMLRTWSGLCDPQKVAVIQFNAGHWDISHWNDEPISLTSVEEYCKNIVRIADSLKHFYPNAKIVFATTMPMNPNGQNSVNFRYTHEIERYNEAVKKVLADKIPVNDLFAEAKDFTAEKFLDYCHLTDEANAEIGKKVAAYLRKFL